MANTSSRTLRLLSLLQTHRFWSGEELADRLDVSVRTLRRDVDRLRELGYPVQADRGIGGGYQLAPGASLPPLVLDDEEAVALAVGLQSAANGSLTGIAEASVRALTKVVQVMPRQLRRRVEAIGSTTVATQWGEQESADPELLVLLAQASRDDESIRFEYVARDGAATNRRVEPVRLVTVGRRWYLVGYDLDRGDWRSFRLDRMAAARRTGRRFLPREVPGGDAAAYVRAGLERNAGQARVSAELRAPAELIRDRIGRWAEVTALDADRCRVDMGAESLEWAIFALGVADAPIVSCAPASFAARLEDWSRRFRDVPLTMSDPDAGGTGHPFES
ncbi:helix-turn-helix transcriptional regulator [Microlunatus soli]|uniref:Predicted DNA-binding transcriptional regulator YafY, contains an HTH and WYL domains n=1 Tax=Microlunatus soli TaxID=630515 RepID=A0A1H1P5V6_9ACTN|nr:YafY family protein [Microlunatus soli]SDS06668.1 Predicted DNA-binding transcriptional regulator YafY, contains an HTH and WYL domains [Microlunatus soli]